MTSADTSNFPQMTNTVEFLNIESLLQIFDFYIGKFRGAMEYGSDTHWLFILVLMEETFSRTKENASQILTFS